MGGFLNIAGHQFGGLTAVRRMGRNAVGHTQWECLCECGATKLATVGHLRSGHTVSCGCRRNERIGRLNRTHGEPRTSKEYVAWQSMRARCHRASTKQFADYGGRGIAVCPRWRVSFEAFLADVGRAPSPDLTIDRIDNNDGYKCGHWACCDGVKNVRWATRTEQANNRRPRRNGALTEVRS